MLLPNGDISGAMGAYAISTSKIYLNQDWLLGASAAQVISVLTEELGHHLDGELNSTDTPGDEGEVLKSILEGVPHSSSLAKDAKSQNDWLTIRISNGRHIHAEAALVLGGEGNDTLIGTSGDDYIQGYAGNDLIEGGEGNDYLVGGDGIDSINGGSGDDQIATGHNIDNT